LGVLTQSTPMKNITFGLMSAQPLSEKSSMTHSFPPSTFAPSLIHPPRHFVPSPQRPPGDASIGCTAQRLADFPCHTCLMQFRIQSNLCIDHNVVVLRVLLRCLLHIPPPGIISGTTQPIIGADCLIRAMPLADSIPFRWTRCCIPHGCGSQPVHCDALCKALPERQVWYIPHYDGKCIML
jgi:hypothetical protein